MNRTVIPIASATPAEDASRQRKRQAAKGRFELQPVMVPDADVPLADAISAYLNDTNSRGSGSDRAAILVLGPPWRPECIFHRGCPRSRRG